MPLPEVRGPDTNDTATVRYGCWRSAILTLAWGFLRFLVLLDSQIPGELEPFEQLLRGRLRQADVRRALSSPTAGHGEENLRSLGDERLLQLGGKHQVP